MRSLSRVIWCEGMHLAQHHFQTQSRYFEDSVTFALSNLFHKPYGLVGYELDADALRNGTVSLVHARGMMPDGLAFQFPDADPLPEPRDIGPLFLPTQESHLLVLVIPPLQSGQANCGTRDEGSSMHVRFTLDERQVVDDTTGQDTKVIGLGRKNFRLALDMETDDSTVALPLARIRRDGTGHFIYDQDYIPPCLQVGASPQLLQLLRRLLDVLEAKSAALVSERVKEDKSVADYAAEEVASFWLAHTIHSSIAPLTHHWETRRTSPEKLYAELARLAGALCTFSLGTHPKDLPSYQHDQLGECFGRLDEHIRANLEVVIPTARIVVPLERTRQFLFTGKVADRRCFGPSDWILGVRAEGGDLEVAAKVPQLVKVCSAQHIARLVREGIPGMPLRLLPAPPSAISPRIGSHYFLIAQTGPCWESTQKTGEVGVYVPETLRVSGLELLVVPHSGNT